jgi:hypothetical protein
MATPGRRNSRLRGGADGEKNMEQTPFKVAYVITERNDQKYWNRIGVAFTNKDGSINVKLDALPLGGQLQLRDYEPREELDAANAARLRATRPSPGAQVVAEQNL